MEINRSNYEIWIIDWLDGKLDNDQVRMVEHFLKQNPDLSRETENLNELHLAPSKNKFKGKTLLKKSASELTDSQFENLCVAHLENDLSENQESELFEIIAKTPGKQKIFDTIQKIKVQPSDIKYPYKNLLYKKTFAEKLVRVSAVVLSAAAMVSVALIIFNANPLQIINNPAVEAANIKPADLSHETSIKPQANNLNSSVPVKSNDNKLLISSVTAKKLKSGSDSSYQKKDPEIIRLQEPEKLNSRAEINLASVENHKSLIPSTTKRFIPAAEDEEEYHNRISRFIAKNFREKILKESNSTDSPLKGYEIATAGVTGLNKLLGWEMALNNINDDKGELKSVYFSSKILKFNTPVKK
jgi:hypothetical protein